MVLSCVIACTLQTLLQMLCLTAVYANTPFKALLDTSHLFRDMPLYGHVVAILILMNCYGIAIYYYDNLLTLKIRPFMKICSHTINFCVRKIFTLSAQCGKRLTVFYNWLFLHVT